MYGRDGWSSNNSFTWTTTGATTTIYQPVTVATYPSAVPAARAKPSVLDWLADEVDAICALTRAAA